MDRKHIYVYIGKLRRLIESETKKDRDEALQVLDKFRMYLLGQTIDTKLKTVDTTENEVEMEQKEVYESLEEDIDNPQIDNPTHYQSMDAELNLDAITCMRAAFGRDVVKDFCLCNAFKYIYRNFSKGGDIDVAKAIWYLNKFLELGGNNR